MSISMIQTGASLVLKIANEKGGLEQTIGFCDMLSVSVATGQKEIFTVDSPFPQEIAQAAAPILVTGSMRFYLLKGSDPIRAGIMTHSTDPQSDNRYPINAASRYSHYRLYDRATQQLVYSLDFCKVKSFDMGVSAKQMVRYNVAFSGMFFSYGQS